MIYVELCRFVFVWHGIWDGWIDIATCLRQYGQDYQLIPPNHTGDRTHTNTHTHIYIYLYIYILLFVLINHRYSICICRHAYPRNPKCLLFGTFWQQKLLDSLLEPMPELRSFMALVRVKAWSPNWSWSVLWYGWCMLMLWVGVFFYCYFMFGLGSRTSRFGNVWGMALQRWKPHKVHCLEGANQSRPRIYPSIYIYIYIYICIHMRR